ncbi:MAG: hypothetical protein JRG91_17340 [Deltaproteobacteria bacterium]|nr:hypothetical protein [Deltaproteobacteria bacterium]
MRRALLCIVPFLALAGCDQGYDGWTDAVLDTMPDTSDPGVESETDGGTPCTYPEGPFAFSRAGDIVGPMFWPTAIRGTDERTTTPDFDVWHCDPEIKSIFLHAAAAT